jgi:trk system potassium uptake protein TrkA
MYIIVIGGGKIGFFLAKRLLADKHTVVLIEKNKSICEDIAKQLQIVVVNGDGCDSYYLEEAGIRSADVIAAVTGKDEDNLVACQLAKDKFHIRRAVAIVNDPKNEHMFSELGVDIPVDTTEIIAKIIEEEVSLADFVNLMSFDRGRLALVRIDLPEYSPVVNKEIREINLPADSVFVSIIRKQSVIVPKGNTVLEAGDDVVALTLLENKQELLKMLLGEI